MWKIATYQLIGWVQVGKINLTDLPNQLPVFAREQKHYSYKLR